MSGKKAVKSGFIAGLDKVLYELQQEGKKAIEELRADQNVVELRQSAVSSSLSSKELTPSVKISYVYNDAREIAYWTELGLTEGVFPVRLRENFSFGGYDRLSTKKEDNRWISSSPPAQDQALKKFSNDLSDGVRGGSVARLTNRLSRRWP